MRRVPYCPALASWLISKVYKQFYFSDVWEIFVLITILI